MFPPFVLAKVYLKGSLKNTEKGLEFGLKNVIDSGTVVEFGPISIDGTVYNAEAISIITGSSERPGDQVTRMSPMPVYVGSAFTIRVNGVTLAPGEHAISISILTREIGRIHFDVQDILD
jgi:hydroxymethylglutaryl-CoA reductase (NADPH)